MLHHFTLIKYNAQDERYGIYCTDDEIIEKKLVDISGNTAIEVVALTEEYLKNNGKGHFYKINSRVWSDGFGQEIRIADFVTSYEQD